MYSLYEFIPFLNKQLYQSKWTIIWLLLILLIYHKVYMWLMVANLSHYNGIGILQLFQSWTIDESYQYQTSSFLKIFSWVSRLLYLWLILGWISKVEIGKIITLWVPINHFLLMQSIILLNLMILREKYTIKTLQDI